MLSPQKRSLPSGMLDDQMSFHLFSNEVSQGDPPQASSLMLLKGDRKFDFERLFAGDGWKMSRQA
jgi:hypothetical protein